MSSYSRGSTGSLASKAIFLLLIVLATALLVLLIPFLGRKLIEKFEPENYASAVVAQNKKVFEKLARM